MVQVERKPSLVHRSRIDIIANILRVAEVEVRRTHIMYRCNLSFKQLHTYLDFLTERRLIKHIKVKGDENPSGKYQTTSKGRSFVQAYSSIRALLSTTELDTDE